MNIKDKIRRAKRQVLKLKKSRQEEEYIPFLHDEHSGDKDLLSYLESIK